MDYDTVYWEFKKILQYLQSISNPDTTLLC